MMMKLESRHFLIVGKILSTISLLVIIFIWTMFLIVIVPMIAIAFKSGKKNFIDHFNLSLAMIPTGICALLIWRMWYPKWNPNFIDSKKLDSFRRYLPSPRPPMKRPIR